MECALLVEKWQMNKSQVTSLMHIKKEGENNVPFNLHFFSYFNAKKTSKIDAIEKLLRTQGACTYDLCEFKIIKPNMKYWNNNTYFSIVKS